jgi:hypothetical protein
MDIGLICTVIGRFFRVFSTFAVHHKTNGFRALCDALLQVSTSRRIARAATVYCEKCCRSAIFRELPLLDRLSVDLHIEAVMKSSFVVAAALVASGWSLAAQAQADQSGNANQPDATYSRSTSTDAQPAQAAAAPETTQAVGGTTPMSSQSGSASGSRTGTAPSLFDQVFRGN